MPSGFFQRLFLAHHGPHAQQAAAIWRLYEQLDASQWLTGSELWEVQLKPLRRLLVHCRDHVPYYRRLFREHGVVPERIETADDLRTIPVLPRDVVQSRLPELTAERLPPGVTPTGTARTSGSSGAPISVLQTNVVNLWWWALALRDSEWCSVDPRGVLAAIRAVGGHGRQERLTREGLSRPDWGPPLCDTVLTGQSYLMGIAADPDRQLDWLAQVNPDYLLSYPSHLDLLAREAERGFRLPRLRVIQSIAESLAPEVRVRVESAFGVPVKNIYSCQEAGYLASPCPVSEGLHIHAESVLLEVLDHEDRPCAPEQAGRVVLTSLRNYRMPIVRYEIGDMATPGESRCRCGRGLAVLREVSGKVRPLFQLPDGRRKNSSELATILSRIEALKQVQCEQTARDRVVVHVVPGRAWCDADQDAVLSHVRGFFEPAVRVDLELLPRIPLPPGGKLQSMVCRVADERAAA